MPILLKTQAEGTAKTPIQARRARDGSLCGFHGAAELVPSSSRKPDVAPTCGSVAGMPSAEEERLRAGFSRGRSRKRRSRTKPRGRARPAAVTTARRAGSFGDLRGRSKSSEKQPQGVAVRKKPAVSRKTAGFQRNLRGEHRKMVNGKTKFALWITPECKQLVDDCYADDQCQSRGEYIEKAIWFYSGFLHAEKAGRYLPKVLQQILSGTLDRFAERIGRQLFKLAVEQNVNNHILASDTDIDAQSYQKMRGLSMEEVKRTNGRIDFKDALLSERDV